MEELKGYALDHNLDIIGVVETLLNESVCDGEIAIKDYITYRKDRAHVTEERGVAFY